MQQNSRNYMQRHPGWNSCTSKVHAVYGCWHTVQFSSLFWPKYLLFRLLISSLSPLLFSFSFSFFLCTYHFLIPCSQLCPYLPVLQVFPPFPSLSFFFFNLFSHIFSTILSINHAQSHFHFYPYFLLYNCVFSSLFHFQAWKDMIFLLQKNP